MIIAANSLFSQNPNTPLVNVSSLDWAHRSYDRSLPKYDSLTRLRDRVYILTGVAITEGWRSEYTARVGYSVGAGYKFSPIHSAEARLNYYVNHKCSSATKISGLDITSGSRLSFELGYAFNLSNYGARAIHTSRYEFLYTAGLRVGGSDDPLSLYNGVRAQYSVFKNTALYIEPRINFNLDTSALMDSRLAMSLMAGASFTLFDPEFYMHEVLTPLGVRNNLLYDLVGGLNLGLEAPITKRYSVVVDMLFPWYGSTKNHMAYRINRYSFEGRYWLGSKESRERRGYLIGFFMGARVGGGKFDIMFDPETGRQGSFMLGGGTFGFAHHLKKNLHLEYAVTGGVLSATYRKYRWDGFSYTLISPRELEYRQQFVNVVDASVTLVWMLDFNPNK